MALKDSVADLRKERLPLIIFGAGIVGEMLFRACAEAGIEVECFCDNNLNKTRSLFCGLKVVPVRGVPGLYRDPAFLISAADVGDVVSQLGRLGYSRLYSGRALLRAFDLSSHEFSAPQDFAEYAAGAYILCHDSHMSPDKIFLRSVDILVTERCSLRCRDCSNLMQYYDAPRNCATAEVFRDIEALCAAVDEINEFRIIGGEPMMNPEFHLTVRRLIEESKVRKAVVYTNGTIVPAQAQLEAMESRKVLFIITDYGRASRNLERLKSALSSHGIAFYAFKARGWSDCSSIAKHGRIAAQQEAVFEACCAKNTFTLTDGRLFRCPFSANVHRLGAAPDFGSDYVRVATEPEDDGGLAALRRRLREFIVGKKSLEVCDYCSGRPFGAVEIAPAVQTPKPLPYDRHVRE